MARLVLSLGACLGGFTCSAVLQPQYSITDLGTLGGSQSWATGINANGQVVGASYTAGGAQHAFLYSGGVMTDLTPGAGSSTASGINGSGQVVGAADGQAFLDSGGVLTYFLSSFGIGSSAATSINNHGQIVGQAQTASGSHAFLYSGGALTDLTPSSPFSQAEHINDNGQIVGSLSLGNNQAFLYNGGTLTVLNSLGYAKSSANSINGLGQIVGWGYMDFPADCTHAFLQSGSVMRDLANNPYSVASDINDNGDIVGFGTNPFLYRDGVMYDLNGLIDPASGWHLSLAYAINDNGQIVGQGLNAQGQADAFLLTPIPEPGALLLLVPGLIALACSRRRPTCR